MTPRLANERRPIPLGWIVPLLLWLFISAWTAGAAMAALGTHSFTNHDGGTYPLALVRSGSTITVDLSPIVGATIYRATLDPGRSFDYIDVTMNDLPTSTMRISYEGESLSLTAPRFEKFDATSATVLAAAGSGVLTLTIDDSGLGFGEKISLDVLCDRALPSAVPTVTDASARFDDGDVMITFTEPNPPFDSDSVSCTLFYETLTNIDQGSKTRFRIYRSTEALTSEEAIAGADLVDEIKPLSGWNPRLLGPAGHCYPPYGGGTVATLPIDDGVLASGDTGVYVDRYTGEGSDAVYYFVSHTVDGAEDFSVLEIGRNATGVVGRTPGPGMVLFYRETHLPEFNYVPSEGQYYFVQWAAPPTSNFPSSPFNYFVVLPSEEIAVPEPGVDLKLHCWGGSLTGYYGWWWYADQGHILIAGNQFPFQDWWTGYHENLGTLKAYHEGTVKPFTIHRLLAFVFDFATPRYNVNTDRITLSGTSMGGTGASLVGLRNGQIFSNMVSWCGVHIPRGTPQFVGSLEAAWGNEEWDVAFSNEEFAERFGGEVVRPEDGYVVWDYYDNDQWLRANPDRETPWLTYSNGVNDDGIGWEQAVTHTQALIDTWRPFNFQWGMEGHGQRVALLDPYGYDKTQKSHLLFTRNQSMPIFRNVSTDGDFLVETAGKVNPYCTWDTEEITDESDRWEITILIPDAPSGGSYGEVFPDSLIADVVPTRLQSFAIMPDSLYEWTWTDLGTDEVIDSGEVIADGIGRISVPQITIKKEQPRRLSIRAGSAPAAVSPQDGRGRLVQLYPIGPNPMRAPATIRYSLPAELLVQITVFDLNGRRIARLVDQGQEAGTHTIDWDGSGTHGNPVPSGTYFIRLRAGGEEVVERLTLVR